MPDEYGTPEMFDIPEAYRKPKRASLADVWGKHRGQRMTCECCMVDIRDGALTAPLATSTITLVRGGRKYHLCQEHATQVKRGTRRL